MEWMRHLSSSGLSCDQTINAISQAWVGGQSLHMYRHTPDTGLCKSWAAGNACSHTGSPLTSQLLTTMSHNHMLRLFDPHASGHAIHIGEGHGDIKGTCVMWMCNHNHITMTRFSHMSDHQCPCGRLAHSRTLRCSCSTSP